jgi:hypothetical protein
VNMDEKIELLTQFKNSLIAYEKSGEPAIRGWLNKRVMWVKNEIKKAKCFSTLTIAAPPIVGGLRYSDVDPFNNMFDEFYGKTLVPQITDMIDKTIGVLRNPVDSDPARTDFSPSKDVELGYAFIAMAMDKDDHELVDVLEAIQVSASSCKIKAERVDEVETNDRITGRILASIRKAEFIIVDLTKERPNVFFEAGYAEGLGKIPIYLARQGTPIHFDLKDYPIVEFRNMKELKEKGSLLCQNNPRNLASVALLYPMRSQSNLKRCVSSMRFRLRLWMFKSKLLIGKTSITKGSCGSFSRTSVTAK